MIAKTTAEEITQGVKGVQDAKASLEHRLNDRRSKRLDAERVLESVTSKFSQVKHLHSKMKETVKVAQHKVSETQAQFSSNEEMMRQKNEALEKMGEQLKASKEARTQDIMKFEEELSKLSSFLIEAKDKYTESKLSDSAANSNNNATDPDNMVPMLEEEESNLAQALQSININTVSDPVDDTTRDLAVDKDAIWGIISAEHEAALQCLQALNDELTKLEAADGKAAGHTQA